MLQTRASFGLTLSNRALVTMGTQPKDLIDMAVKAEGSGLIEALWVGDSIISKPRLECIPLLGAIAAHTSRLRLGVACMATIAQRNPVLLALQWASLDVLSHGRTILSVCNGGSALDGPPFAHELDVMGVRSRERVGRVVEGITILRRLWSEDLVTYSGKYYQFSDVALQPKPVQQPVPILIAVNPKAERVNPATIDRILQRVAVHADGWQTDATPVDTFRRRFDTIQHYAAEHGRDAGALDSCLHLMVNINEDRDQGFQEATTFLASYYGTGAVSRERAELWLAYGSPQAVIDKIAAYIDAGCTTPVLRFVAPRPQEQLQRCIEEVLPAFLL